MHRTIIALSVLATIVAVLQPPSAAADEGGDDGRNPHSRDEITYVFNGEGNNLNTYDTWTWEKTRVITNATDRPNVEGDLSNGLDINAQICFDQHRDDGYYFIAGEDTGQRRVSSGGGQGWGYFQLHVDADTLDVTGATERGKVEPNYFETESANPENYGCGFLSNGDLVTSDVGDQFPQHPASGELILWFRPDTPDGFATGLTDDGTFPRMAYCKIDVNIPTAGQIHVGEDDSIYVGAQRPDTAGLDPVSRPGGIYRYIPIGGWPSGPGECGDATHEPPEDYAGDPDPLLVEGEHYSREVFIPNGPWGMTPSGIVRVPDGLPNAGNFYLSSVFDGMISEFSPDGSFVRVIMRPERGELPPYRTTGTPLGIDVDPNDGTIYFADIAVVPDLDEDAFIERMDAASWNPGAGPGPNGMVRAIRFDENNEPGESIPVNGGLAFPDGIGIVTIQRDVVDPGDDGPGQGRGPVDNTTGNGHDGGAGRGTGDSNNTSDPRIDRVTPGVDPVTTELSGAGANEDPPLAPWWLALPVVAVVATRMVLRRWNLRS